MRCRIAPKLNMYHSSPTLNDDGKLEIHEGDQIEKYTVGNCIGRGTYGKVIKVFDIKNQVLALKMIRIFEDCPEEDVNRELNMLYEVELNKSRSINGNLIMMPITNLIYKQHVCIVYPLMGSNLNDCIHHKNFLYFPNRTLNHIAKQTVKALEFLHSIGITHGDIKPDNIVFEDPKLYLKLNKSYDDFIAYCEFPSIKLIDLGIARREGEDNMVVISALPCRAPEVILEQGYQNVSDIWSLASSLFMIWTGIVVFRGSTLLEQLLLYTTVLGPAPQKMVYYNTRYYVNGEIDIRQYFQTRNLRDAKVIYGKTMRNNLVLKLKDYRGKGGRQNQLLTELLARMFEWDPTDRITATQVLLEPYFSNVS